MILAGISLGLSALSFGLGISQARAERKAQTKQIEAEIAMGAMRAEMGREVLHARQALSKASQENMLFMIDQGAALDEKKQKLFRVKGRINIKILNYHLKESVFDKKKQVTDSAFAYENFSLGVGTKVENLYNEVKEINRKKRGEELKIKTQEILNTLDSDYNRDIGRFNLMQKSLNLNESIQQSNFRDLQESINISLGMAQAINRGAAQNAQSSLQANQAYTGTFLQGIRNGLNDYNLYKQAKAAEV